MQLLWQRHRQTGYTQKQFESICSELAGEDLTRFFDETIRSTADLNYQPWLERVGLQFAPTEDNATPSPSEDQAKKEENGEKEGGDEKKKEPSSDELPKPTPSWTGLDLASSDGKVVVKKVVRGSPGDIAGINVDDELIALDGYRLSLDSIGDRTQTTTPGQTAQVLIARRGKLLERTMELGVPAPKGYKLKAIAEPTDEQKNQLKSWLDPTP
jgi:predicted metalloprotease with PDZ domain